jgi:hypothetical protein
MRRLACSTLIAAGMLVAGLAHGAPPKTATRPIPEPVGLTEVAAFKPERGFIDDPVAVDAGGRLVFIETDGATFSTIVVVEGDRVRSRIPLKNAVEVPLTLALVGRGGAARVFLVGLGEDGKQRGVLMDLEGKRLATFGPAAEVTLLERSKPPRVSTHRVSSPGRNTVRHEIEVFDLATGKRVGATHTVALDSAGHADSLDFRVNHWLQGWTRAVGTKGGRWDAKSDQRSPDVEAEFDVINGRFVREAPISDVVAYTKRMEVMAGRPDRALFVRVSDDSTHIELWVEGKTQRIELDQPLDRYDAASVGLAIDGAGVRWIGLRVDPVNRDAVARGKADLESLDLFRIEGNRGTRQSRVPVGKRRLRWGVVGDRVWVVERNIGFERGGTVLRLYRVGS